VINIENLNLGFNDAENYKRRENRQIFNTIFVRNIFLDRLVRENCYFLIGEKGTGKTAYSVFLNNNNYKNTVSQLKFIRETDYQKFITLKTNKHLQLSDYTSIWKVIILLLLAKGIDEKEIYSSTFTFSKTGRIKAMLNAIDEYYENAFSPEIIYALNLLEDSKVAVELITKFLKMSGESKSTTSSQNNRFQVNLFYIQDQFEKALKNLKLKENHILLIDGIDIRPDTVPYQEYLDCIKGLSNAVWSLNNDFFASIKDSKGRFRVILLVRPDIFNSIGLQNLTNKVRDNSVYLDWRTTYPSYRTSFIFELADRLLSSQQEGQLKLGEAWDYYFPWKGKSTSSIRDVDPPFYKFLRLSYSRPRDIVTMLHILQEEFISKRKSYKVFLEKDIDNPDFQNKYSEYLMGGIKDQLSFYYRSKDYEMFLRFFNFLEDKADFSYKDYLDAYNKFTDFILNNHDDIPNFVETSDTFLQFLYDTNIICYIEDAEIEPLFRWCYRERSPSNISPKVKLNMQYRIHYGLFKALNVSLKWRHSYK
jgi:hypothetical protein